MAKKELMMKTIKNDGGEDMRVLLAGGGTAGHINPALSIADEIKRRQSGAEFLFIGKKGNMEEKLVPRKGYEIEFIDAEGFKRDRLLRNAVVVAKTIHAIGEAKKILKRFAPDVVVCTGGYISGPVICAAHSLKIPSVIHEQNVYPGVAVKMSERYANVIATSFEKTKELLSHPEKCVLTGNPIRREVIMGDKAAARSSLHIKNKPFILVFGGSLGAQKINETMADYIAQMNDDCYLLFGTGNNNYDDVMKSLYKKGVNIADRDNITVMPYIYNMDEAMSAADIVVSRAGAITISEIMALGKPSVLIPSPNVAHNHQQTNAQQLEKNGAAAVILEKDLTAASLKEKIDLLLNDSSLMYNMGKRAKAMSITDASEHLASIAIELAGK